MQRSIIILLLLFPFISSAFIDLTPFTAHYDKGANAFRVSIDDISQVASVSFELTMYSGDCDIPFIFSNEEMTTKVEVTVSSLLRKIVFTTTNVVNKYFFKTKCDACSYQIMIKENSSTNFILEKGYSNVVLISQGETENTYTIKKEEEKTSDVILAINAINCVPSIIVDGKTFSDGKFYNTKIEDTTKDFTFAIKVKEMDTKNTELTEQCSIVIDVINDQTPQVIPEGALMTYPLLPSNPTRTFKYININTPISITVTPFFNKEITISISTQEGALKTYTITKKKTIMIDSIQDSDILISITRSEGTEDIFFDFIIREQKGNPRYLYQDKVNYEYMYPDSKTYFYTDIKKGDYGDIIVNFRQGGGKICVSLVEKDKIYTDANWLRRVNLDLTCTEKIISNMYIQPMSIESDSTEKCDKGCEVYIEITSQEKSKKTNMNYLSEFTISFHSSQSSNIIQLPLNEDNNGGTSLKLNENFISSTQINVDTNKVVISYNSLFYTAYLLLDKEGVPSSMNYDIKLDNSGIYEITTENSLKGKWINFAFEAPYKDDSDNFYQIKIMPQFKNTHNILYASSSKSEMCDVTEGVCYFIVPVHEFEQQSSITVGAIGVKGRNRSVIGCNLYVNVVEGKLIDSLDYSTDDIKKYLPTETAEIYGKDYVIIPNEKMIFDKDYYIIVMVKTNVEKIEFLVSVNLNGNYVFFDFATNPKFFYIPPGRETIAQFFNYGDSHYVENFILFGKGNYDVWSARLIKYIMTASRDEGYGIYVTTYFIVPIDVPESKFNSLKAFTLKEFYKTYFVVKVEDKDLFEHKALVSVNLKVSNIKYLHPAEEEDKFSIKATVVSESFIKAFKINQKIEPSSPFIDGNFFLKEKVLVVKAQVEKSKPYLFIQLNQISKNIYDTISIDISSNVNDGKAPGYSLPTNKYYTNIIENDKVIYRLTKESNTDKIFEVEISRTNDNIQYAVEKVKEAPTFKNETELIKKESVNNKISKLIFSLDSDTDQSIIISFFKDNTQRNDENEKIMIKYQTAKTEDDLSTFTYDRKIIVPLSKDSNSFNIKAENIIKDSKSISSATYLIRLYNKTEDFDISSVDTLFDEGTSIIVPLKEATVTLSNKDSQLIYTIEKTSIPKEIYILISTTFITNDNKEYKLGYDVKEFNQDHPDPDNTGLAWYWYLLIGLGALLIIGGIIGGVCLYKKKKEKKITDVGNEGLIAP